MSSAPPTGCSNLEDHIRHERPPPHRSLSTERPLPEALSDGVGACIRSMSDK